MFQTFESDYRIMRLSVIALSKRKRDIILSIIQKHEQNASYTRIEITALKLVSCIANW